MHFASSLLKFFLATISFLEFLYGILLVLSRCCCHHIVENSILYKKDIQHFYIGPILYSENKIIRSVVGGKIDGQILSGTRSEKPKILFGTRDEKRKNLFGTKLQFRKILFGSQRVKTWVYVLRWLSVNVPALGLTPEVLDTKQDTYMGLAYAHLTCSIYLWLQGLSMQCRALCEKQQISLGLEYIKFLHHEIWNALIHTRLSALNEQNISNHHRIHPLSWPLCFMGGI